MEVTNNVEGEVNDTRERYEDAMGGRHAADEVEREVSDGVNGDNGDGEKDLNGSIINKEEYMKMAYSDSCTPQSTADIKSGSQSNIVTWMKIRPRLRKVALAVCGFPYMNPFWAEEL